MSAQSNRDRMVEKETIVEYSKARFEEEGEIPSVNQIIEHFGMNTTAFYKMFPGKLVELCEAIGAPLPERAEWTKQAIESRSKPGEIPEKLTREQMKLQKRILKMLDKGSPVTKIAAEIGDIDLVSEIANKWRGLHSLDDYVKALAALKEWCDDDNACFQEVHPVFESVDKLTDEIMKLKEENNDLAKKSNEEKNIIVGYSNAAMILIRVFADVMQSSGIELSDIHRREAKSAIEWIAKQRQILV